MKRWQGGHLQAGETAMKEGVTMCVGGGGGGGGGGAPVSRKVNGHHIESAEVVQCVFRAAGMVHLRNMNS